MSKEELRILNNRPKERIVPLIEYIEPKPSPIDDDKLINICVNLHKSSYNTKISQGIDVKTKIFENMFFLYIYLKF